MERTEMMYTINSQLEFKIKVWTWRKIRRKLLHTYILESVSFENNIILVSKCLFAFLPRVA